MPSSYTVSARFELQATGENVNAWGVRLNTGLTLADFNVNGWTNKALSTDYTLTSANGSADEARSAMLKFTGTGAYTVTVPAVSKRYDVWNACTGLLTLTNGSASVYVYPGETVSVVTDGGAAFKRVQPLDFGGTALSSVSAISGLALPTTNSQAASKLYVDNTAFAMAAGALPGQGGNAGKILTTDGTTAGWGTSFTNLTLTTPAIVNPTITGGILASGGMTLSGGQTITGGELFSGSSKQNVVAMAALDIDLAAGEFFTKSISAGSTFTFSNTTANTAQAFALDLTISSAAVPAWPASVKWHNQVNPSATLGNGKHTLAFVSFDGGTTWIGRLAAFNHG